MADYGRPGVYISERLLPAPIAAVGTANAAGAAVGKFAQGPETVTLVTSWYDFVQKFGGYNASFPATFGVGQFFQNGGSELYVRRVLASDAVAADADLAPAVGSTAVGTVTAKNRGADGNNLRVQFTPTVGGAYTLSVYREGGTSSSDTDATNDVLVERFSNVILTDPLSSDYAPTIVALNSQFISLIITDNVSAPATSVTPLTSGSDGTAPTQSDYTAVFSDFESLSRPLVLFLPEISEDLSEANALGTQNAALDWAAENNAFAVVDVPKDKTADEAITYAGSLNDTSFGAVYYPAVYISDPLGRSTSALRKVGPAGSVAGLYLFTDKQFGPYKAPAGLRATIRGAVAVERAFTSAELDNLNTATKSDGTFGGAVNALRNLPGAGVVSMGGRTLLQDGTANRYVNMRRSLIYIRKSLQDLTQFAVFENNSERLWAQLRTTISVFLTGYLNQGGLRGTIPADAFYVKCDAENNSATDIANGEVHIEVGVSLQYPAEFVVITLTQSTAA
jgi:phage tail sheath protein FI